MNSKPLAFVQGLRGIAALVVVLWHGSRYLGPYGTGRGAVFAPGAAMGVDLFFIISGFIMVHTTRGNDGSWRYAMDFAIKRATRIWPVWIVALAASIALRADLSFLTNSTKQSWLLHSLAFVPTPGVHGDIPPVFGFPVLGVGWTLNYEMYFYAFFGLAMLFGRWRWVVFFTWLAATLFVVPYCAGHLAGDNWTQLLSVTSAHDAYSLHYVGLMTNPLILLFAAGVILGLIHHARWRIDNAPLLSGLVGAAIAGVIAQYMFSFRTGHGILEWGLSLLPLMLLLTVASKRIVIHTPRWLVYTGDISFSLYLLHPTVQGSFDRAARVFGHTPAGYVPIIATTVLSIAAAALSHRFLERGLCERLKRAASLLLEQLPVVASVHP